MMRRLTGLISRHIAGQIVILVVAAVLLFHIGASLVFSFLRNEVAPNNPATPAIVAVRMLDAVAPDKRVSIARALNAVEPALAIAHADDADLQLPAQPNEMLADGLQRALGAAYTVRQIPRVSNVQQALVTLKDGEVWRLAQGPQRGPPSLANVVLVTLAFIALNVAVLSVWAARSITAPLTRLATSVESFSIDKAMKPLPEDGPEEVRVAARALNRMQARISDMVAQRRGMLAAVGHDLRTPITRLRLRTESVSDEATRILLLRDLTQMDAMVNACLAYLRGVHTGQSAERIDVAVALQTICDEFSDMGSNVSYIGPDHFTLNANPTDFTRAITNLIENAIRYAGAAHVALSTTPVALGATPGHANIDVSDNGPGINDADKARLLEPFERGSAARTGLDDPGFGLGLAIARGVAQAHGGTLSLLDNQPTGLIARLTLPVLEISLGNTSETRATV